MTTSVKQMMEEANAAVPKITPAEAREMIAKGNTLIVDVREPAEVEASGKVAGAVHHRARHAGIPRRCRDALSRQEFLEGEDCHPLLRVRRARGAGRQDAQGVLAMARSIIWAASRIGPSGGPTEETASATSDAGEDGWKHLALLFSALSLAACVRGRPPLYQCRAPRQSAQNHVPSSANDCAVISVAAHGNRDTRVLPPCPPDPSARIRLEWDRG